MNFTRKPHFAESHRTSVRFDPSEREFAIIGAGVCGLYQLHKLLQLGADLTLLEPRRPPKVPHLWLPKLLHLAALI